MSVDGQRRVVAVPVADGKLCAHFGHCQQFALFTVDLQAGRIEDTRWLDAPPHEPGLLPRWLSGERAEVVLAGGMGQRARALCEQQGMEVILGAPPEEPRQLVQAFLAGALSAGRNPCDH